MRIVIKKLSEIKPHPKNARRHSSTNIEIIKRSLQEYGQRTPIVIGQDNHILKGCGTYQAFLELAWPTIRVVIAEGLTPEQELAYALMDNKSSDTSEFDHEKVKDVIQFLDGEGFDLDNTGFHDFELEALLEQDISEDNYVKLDDVPEVVESITKPGDVWLLGKHKVLCGDCTLTNLWKNKASMLITDPPYGVDYIGKTKDALTIKHDQLESLKPNIKKWFDAAVNFSAAGAYWFMTAPPGPLQFLFANDWMERGILRQILIWVKDSMVLGHSEYHYKHETLLFGWIPGNRLQNKDRTKVSVWHFDRPKASKDHPTMKPVGLFMQAIKNHTIKNDIVFDPFLGSGTTLIAAEKLDRICYGIEIEPHYVDVTVKRWEELTGKKAILQKKKDTRKRIK
jgi:DNA modification methylase